jgi:hypothetical protein
MKNRGRSPISTRFVEIQFKHPKSGSVPDLAL